MFQDYLFYGTDVNSKYAFRMCHLSHLVQEAQKKHELNGKRGELLGEAMLASALTGSILMDEARVNIRFQVGNEYALRTETTRKAEMKAFLQAAPDSALLGDLDEGIPWTLPMKVVSARSKIKTGKLFESVTEETVSSIEEAYNAHLKNSFQMNAVAKLECWEDADGKLHAFGAIWMELPNLPKETKGELYNHIDSIGSLKDLYNQGDDPDRLASALIPHQVRAINSMTPKWFCTCSQEAAERAITSLPISEIRSMIEEEKGAEVTCDYCNIKYKVAQSTLEALLPKES